MSADQKQVIDGQEQNLPIEFSFENHTVRSVEKDNEIWFVADDVCRVLEHTDTSKAVSRLDEDEKAATKVRTPGGEQSMLIISQSGLYGLILTSRKPQAKRFKRWVTHEVLPSLHKTGRYEVGQEAGRQEPADPESTRYARDRLFKIFEDGHLNPDHLLKALFGKDIPYTPSRKHPFFLTESCEALGISETVAAGRIPDSETTTLIIDAAEGQLERRAITEAALYFLAFSRQALEPKKSKPKMGTKTPRIGSSSPRATWAGIF
ncbi:Bro-N domain-containing protein [Methylocystis sp. IM4]|uniref:BRO-N domain-containing protein n=1 Tax=Methylocystis sp. IM4 TaxID=3136560 RepID=UPI00311A5683